MYLAHADAYEFTIHGKPFTFASPNQPPLLLDGYAETMRFESICGGRATYIDVISYWCSEDQTAAYNFWYTLHEAVFPTLAVALETTVLAGDCPCMCA